MPKNIFSEPGIKTGITICKALMRNGYDAYPINAQLQKILCEKLGKLDVDIACACDAEVLAKLVPSIQPGREDESMAMLEENGIILHFYPTDVENASHPERAQRSMTPRMLRLLNELGQAHKFRMPKLDNPDSCFEDFECGQIRLLGIPSNTLSHDYLLAIRALRHAANCDLPIAPQTWVSIVQAANRILDYVPASSIMEEWRNVAAESMWKFVQLLFDANLLHGIMPEVAALSCVMQERNDESDEQESVFDHTIACMRYYPEGSLPMDWYGVLATMFHDIGKLYTAEHFAGRWTFYQHHRVGAAVTRKILRRLHFEPEDIDLICHLVRNHMMFHFMLTDRGLRRFKSLPETERLIEICRADIKARDGSYTSFNHNQKYLNRTETSELMLEPLLNGNEIMEYTKLPPGPEVGNIRDALLKAQIAGLITNTQSAVEFVKRYTKK